MAQRRLLGRRHWSFDRRVDRPVVATIGLSVAAGVAGGLSPLWPTWWMAFPAALFAGGLALLITPKRDPLVVTLLDDCQFENWQHIAVIAYLHIQIENTTSNDIRVGGYAFTCDNEGREPWEGSASTAQRQSVTQEIHRREEQQEPGQMIRNFRRIAARQTVSGWLLTTITPIPARGTPTCTVIVNDDLRNAYWTTLPKREPRTYGQ